MHGKWVSVYKKVEELAQGILEGSVSFQIHFRGLVPGHAHLAEQYRRIGEHPHRVAAGVHNHAFAAHGPGRDDCP